MEMAGIVPKHIAIVRAWEEKLASIQSDDDEWCASAEQLQNTRLLWSEIKQKAGDNVLAPSCYINEYGSVVLSWSNERTEAFIRIQPDNLINWFFTCADMDIYCMHFNCKLCDVTEFIDNLCEFFTRRIQQLQQLQQTE